MGFKAWTTQQARAYIGVNRGRKKPRRPVYTEEQRRRRHIEAVRRYQARVKAGIPGPRSRPVTSADAAMDDLQARTRRRERQRRYRQRVRARMRRSEASRRRFLTFHEARRRRIEGKPTDTTTPVPLPTGTGVVHLTPEQLAWLRDGDTYV